MTVFSYGQTGSGKTFTYVIFLVFKFLLKFEQKKLLEKSVLGEVGKNTLICEKSGIFLRLLRDIFKYKEMNQKVTLRVKGFFIFWQKNQKAKKIIKQNISKKSLNS